MEMGKKKKKLVQSFGVVAIDIERWTLMFL
jgi:hypothetical protein